MNQADASRAQWKKSSRSSGNGQCVEVADFDTTVALRDSKDPSGPVLVFERAAWASFLAGAKCGVPRS
ncbi:DUF397 domain-containing protein [Micromonospora sp. HNM0581]|uniref:DUF397 domain-containing protein n=1 Tax=Micromonospora sp. HNM0581 TaxID=2716341 RepID=UPI00146E101F|nr:DUF397 domain-containing protein [Micromonospora sp. HNM0581]NLU78034.1 DUF397 domain-containing protein [Micromonospora sp. HNM0581]